MTNTVHTVIVCNYQIAKALGCRSHISQVRLYVATPTKVAAQTALGVSGSEMRDFVRSLSDTHRHAQLPLSKPGQVFAVPTDSYGDDVKMIAVGVSVERPRHHEVGVEMNLDTITEIHVAAKDSKAKEKAEAEQRQAEYEESRARRARNVDACKKAIDDSTDALVDLGIHVGTVTVGRSDHGIGVVLSAEAYTRLVEQARIAAVFG
jgi:hypothetical protein